MIKQRYDYALVLGVGASLVAMLLNICNAVMRCNALKYLPSLTLNLKKGTNQWCHS